MVKMTEPQRRALECLSRVDDTYASALGYAMHPDRQPPLKAQGAGRIGGTMLHRLARMGWAERCRYDSQYQTYFRITQAGRDAMKQEPSE